MALRPQNVTPELLTKVTKALGITALDQWYHVSHHTASKAIGARALNTFGGIVGFLKAAYPSHQFDEEKLLSRKNFEKDQKFLEVIIRQLFPNTEIHTKARKAVGIVNPETDAYLEIDFWIPSLKLGIEYQDKHHYEYQWYANSSLEDYQKRDNFKKAAMPNMGYTLINIGFWWDKSPESLIATIRKARPDLLQEHDSGSADPIPDEPPLGFVNEGPIIPGVAGLMSPFVPSNKNFDPTNWYAGEKYDGIRGVYNAALQKIFSRSGKELSVHPSLLTDIPNMLLEGEITAGRGNYNKTTALSYHTQHGKVHWPMYRYVLYDIPDATWENYTLRYSSIISGLSIRQFVFSQVVFRALLVNKSHLEMLVNSIISDAGEGVIVQQDARYEFGRAKGIAKIKVRRDADAQVLSVNKPSCNCKLVSGVTVDINFYVDFDPSVLKEGDIVSYYHSGYSQSGKPKQAEIYKVRYDLTWEQIVNDQFQNSKRGSVKDAVGGGSLIPAHNPARNKMGHWSKSQNVRAFLDEFARNAGFDPLEPENWYPVRLNSLVNAGGGGLLDAYGYNLKKALLFAYPELKFEVKNFRTRRKAGIEMQHGHWNKTRNVRAFFDEFARTSGFDPLVPNNWYAIRARTVQNAGGSGLLNAYGYSLRKALLCAYPELTFNEEKLRTRDKISATKMQYGHWNKAHNVRAFFDQFAATAGFDPLVPENWYLIKTKALRNAGGDGLLKAYSDLKTALSIAYPKLQFEEDRFVVSDTQRASKKEKGYWTKLSNVRAFFDEYARTAGFDPLVPANWYPIRIRAVQQAGGSTVLSTYGSSLMKALSCAYPELNFDFPHSRIHERHKIGHWNDAQNVRAFFDKFARANGFDPLNSENWYSVRTLAIQKAGGSGILDNYNFMNALLFAYPDVRFEAKFRSHDATRAKTGHWKRQPYVRAFFDKFARTSGFDPLIPENWYQFRHSTLLQAKGAGMLKAYSFNVRKALSCAYPDLSFEAARFRNYKTRGKAS